MDYIVQQVFRGTGSRQQKAELSMFIRRLGERDVALIEL